MSLSDILAIKNNKMIKQLIPENLQNVSEQLALIQSDFNTAVGAITVDSEVVLARDGETTLDVRLDKMKDNLTANTTSITDINSKLNVAVVDTKTGTFIQSTVADDYIAEVTKIEGNTVVTPTNAGQDISPDNIATIVSAGDSAFDVVACGKNLLNSNLFTNATVNGITLTKNADGSITLNGTATSDALFTITMPKMIGSSFYQSITRLSGSNSGDVSLLTYEVGYGYVKVATISQSINFGSTSLNSAIFDDTSIIVRIKVPGGVVCTNLVIGVQIEQNSTATTYEPYKGNQINNSSLPTRSLPNGVKDEIVKNADGTWKHVQKVGKVIFDGTRSWSISSTYTECIRFATNISDYKINSLVVVCDKFKYGNWMSDVENIGGHNTAIQINLTIFKSRLITQDVNGLNAWLAVNPITMYYELVTPIETPLSTKYNLTSYKGITNVYTTAPVQPTLTVNMLSRAKNTYEVISDKKANATLDSIIVPTMTNSWVADGVIGYYKSPIGKLEFVGAIKSGTLGSSAFTLPTGYRPLAQKRIACISNGAIGYIVIGTDGTVKPYGNNTYVSLDNISVRLDV